MSQIPHSLLQRRFSHPGILVRLLTAWVFTLLLRGEHNRDPGAVAQPQPFWLKSRRRTLHARAAARAVEMAQRERRWRAGQTALRWWWNSLGGDSTWRPTWMLLGDPAARGRLLLPEVTPDPTPDPMPEATRGRLLLPEAGRSAERVTRFCTCCFCKVPGPSQL